MNIYYSSRFERHYKKLPAKIQDLSEKREAMFIADIFDPLLKTHKLGRNLQGFWAFSVTDSYRVIFGFLENGDIVFDDIGTHDVYK